MPATITANEISITLLLNQVAFQTGVSYSTPDGLDPVETMTVDYRAIPAQKIFEDIATRISKVAQYEDGVVTFSDPEDAHKEFLVLRSGYVDPDAVISTIKTLIGDDARAEILDDRIVVTADRRSLRQVQRLSEHFGRGQDGWRLDVRVVSITKSFRRDLGLDWSIEGGVNIDTTGAIVTKQADLIVTVIGKAADVGNEAALLETASLYVLEGSTSIVRRGQRVPIPRFITSPYGSNETSGYDFINAGFELEASARRVPGGVRLSLKPKISSVIGFVREAPITQESMVEVELVVQSGDWIIISGLESSQASEDISSLPGLSAPLFGTSTDTAEGATLLVLVQARRVFTAE